MPSSLIWKNPGEIVLDVHDLLGDVVAEFTATAGAAGTVDGAAPLSSTADFYNNLWLYTYSGTTAGDNRRVSDYGSGSTYRFTADGNFTATPDTTTKILLARKYKPSDTYRLIAQAVRELARAGYLTPLTYSGFRTGNILSNGHFEDWDSGSAVSSGSYIYTRWKSSDGWSVQGTNATSGRDANIARNSCPFTQYSARLTSNGTNNAYLEYLVPDWGRWAGATFDFYGWAYASAASRVYFRIRDGVNTFTTNASRYADGTDPGGSGTHSGTAGLEELYRQSFTISPRATLLAVDCFILGTAGGSISAYFDDVRLIPTSSPKVSLPVRYYRLPPNMVYVKEVKASLAEGGFDYDMEGLWNTDRHDDGLSYLDLRRGWPNDYHLLISGAGYRTDTLAVATDIELEPTLVAHYTAALVARANRDMDTLAEQMAEAKRIMAVTPRYRPNGARRVR